ncbi:unnamed protein product, partial [marine sediment metagenome]
FALGAAIAEVVRTWFPEQTEGRSDETLAAAAGAALLYYGDRLHEKLPKVGLGFFLSALGALSAEYTSSIFEMLKKKE